VKTTQSGKQTAHGIVINLTIILVSFLTIMLVSFSTIILVSFLTITHVSFFSSFFSPSLFC